MYSRNGAPKLRTLANQTCPNSTPCLTIRAGTKTITKKVSFLRDLQTPLSDTKGDSETEQAENQPETIFIEHIRHSDRMSMDSRSSRIFGHGPMRRNTSPDKRRFP